MRHLALKRLTKSDLTFFAFQYRLAPGAGNQKSINLNADVFIDRFYPSLDAITQGAPIPLQLTLFGPGIRGAYSVARKIVKGAAYKNWRLNGEFVTNPDDDPTRFDELAPDDLAVVELTGASQPDSVRMVLISASNGDDRSLYSALIHSIGTGRRSMVEISSDELSRAVETSRVSDDHPVHELFVADTLIEAVANDSEAARKLFRRRSGRNISRAQLKDAREQADRIGQQGEEFVNSYLSIEQKLGHIQSFTWTSAENAVAPYDFTLTAKGEERVVDSKATLSDFNQRFHMSLAEIEVAANGPSAYDIYRVFEISGDTAKIRIASNIREFALALLKGLSQTPKGVRVDSVSIDPTILDFSAAKTLKNEILDDEDQPAA